MRHLGLLFTSILILPGIVRAEGAICHPSYDGACVPMRKGDVDCAGGVGNGPNYVQGPFKVVGPDEFGLDRDGDGVGCQPPEVDDEG